MCILNVQGEQSEYINRNNLYNIMEPNTYVLYPFVICKTWHGQSSETQTTNLTLFVLVDK